MTRALALGLVALAACAPPVRECAFLCDAQRACALGLTCGTDGYCHADDDLDHCASLAGDGGTGCFRPGDPIVVEVAAGWTHTCARKNDGSVWCWGNNNADQLGSTFTSLASRPAPAQVAGVPTSLVRLAAGDSHNCVLETSGQIDCWGFNFYGQLGTGMTFTQTPTPMGVAQITNGKSIACGQYHTCAALADGSVSCWGQNANGQLGDGTTMQRNAPVTVPQVVNAVEVAAGFTHSCARRYDGSVFCWGENTNGQLGDGTNTSRATAAAAIMSDAAQIAAGLHHTCVVKQDGSVWCWGLNDDGQLGDGTKTDRAVPVRAKLSARAVAVTLDGYDVAGSLSHTCALDDAGNVWCWGANMFGELGDAEQSGHATPTKVSGIFDATTLSAGEQHTCAARADGSVWCWGANSEGQLGNGTTTASTTPTAARQLCE